MRPGRMQFCQVQPEVSCTRKSTDRWSVTEDVIAYAIMYIYIVTETDRIFFLPGRTFMYFFRRSNKGQNDTDGKNAWLSSSVHADIYDERLLTKSQSFLYIHSHCFFHLFSCNWIFACTEKRHLTSNSIDLLNLSCVRLKKWYWLYSHLSKWDWYPKDSRMRCFILYLLVLVFIC